ncbi:DUF1430 domain-containing protein [Bacillus clarus]|uniref:Bacteriocin-associated integral membrane family protein n=1 Tax=Bacillus clarus TaxID=2338372 RepID=A0A090YVX3_9BACI|nr:DUF1430 domain-containing protein [Bacillus clarus]KFN02432.1 bacteriocin-associated integral membrane family protein [Bacillus clarus]RFT65562.1 DUF1430 domain-containing protein [Bacillus clarus]
MRKILYMLLTMVFISVHLLGYFLMSNKQLTDILYSKSQLVHIDYSKAEKNADSNKMLKDIVIFSENNNINISQYKFQSQTDLNIYSSNIKNDPNIYIESGNLPKNHQYLSNIKSNSMVNQSGVFSFPLSNWKMHIYDINQIHNVGIGDEFYLQGANKETINTFIKEFSHYGEISLINENVNSLLLTDLTLVMLVVFSFVIFFIGLFYFLILNRKKMLLQKLWGYSVWRQLASIPKEFAKCFTLIIFVLLIGMISFVLTFNQTHFFMEYIVTFITINVITVCILFVFITSVTWFINQLNNEAMDIKGSLSFIKIQWISAILKIIVSLLLFGIISSSFVNIYELKNQLKGLEYWKQTQNVFRIQVQRLNTNVLDKPKSNRDLNDRFFNFYKEIEANHNAFLIDSGNFHVIGHNNGKPIYSYTNAIKDRNSIYSHKGRSVVIDKNYLKVNPIKDVDGKDISHRISTDKNVLNVLVPQNLKEFENQIIASYKKRFYFQRVEVANIYNKQLGIPINNTPIEDLSVNVIYTKNEQYYFTFDSTTGDNTNRIKDPLAMIYNESVDSSIIGSYTTTNLFFIDKSKGHALENISPALNKTHVTEINNTISVYSETKDQIAKKQWLLLQQTIGLVITIILSIILLISFIWSYYNANVYLLNLKYLFGYSYWKRNRNIILITLISHLTAGIAVYVFYDVNIVFILVSFAIALDLFIINVLGNYLIKKNITKIVKGDHI